jgi:GT2 family glycosyltransferase
VIRADRPGRSPEEPAELRGPAAPGEPGLIVVVALSYDKKDVTLQCLRSVRALNYTPLEVVVVDNGSKDGSADAISEAFPDFHLVRNPTNRGPAGGRNAGLAFVDAHFTPRWVFFIDNDTTLDKDVLNHLAEALAGNELAGIACPKAYQRHPSTTLFSAGVHVDFARASVYDIGCGEEDRGQHDEPCAVRACGSFGMLVESAVLERLRGWDERFDPYGWEDVDLCLRAAEHGYATIYAPRAVLYHAGGRAGRGIVPEYESYKLLHFLLLLRKHATSRDLASGALWAPTRLAHFALRLFRERQLRAFASQLIRAFGRGAR